MGSWQVGDDTPSSPSEVVSRHFRHDEEWGERVKTLIADTAMRVPAGAGDPIIIGLAVEFAIGLDVCEDPYAPHRALLPPDHRIWIEEQLASAERATEPEGILLVARYLASVRDLLFAVLERGTDASVITPLISRAYRVPPKRLPMDDELHQLWNVYRETARDSIHSLGPATADVPLHQSTSAIYGKHTDAFADLVAGGTIIDVKTRTLRDGDTWLADAGRQLLRYGLLADPDQFDIHTVGLYLARYGTLLTWPLRDLANDLAAYPADLGEARRNTSSS